MALGWACGVAQAVLLREGMSLAGGSEVAWGVVLAIWLAGMAVGAWVGVRLGSPAAGGWGAPAMLLVAAGAVVLLRSAPRLAGAAPGEVLVTWRAALVWLAAVLPVATVGGWSFPTLTAALGGRGAAGRAWAWEALGACTGGVVFTFALASLGSPAALAGGLAVAVLLAPPAASPVVAAVGVVGAAALALPWTDRALAEWGWRCSGQGGALQDWSNTRRQRLEVGGGPPAAVFGDGALLATPPDPYLSAPLGHLLALLHPAPRSVLCVGCLSAGVLPALLAHPLVRLEVLEEDPEVLPLLPSWLGREVQRAVADPRVHLNPRDPVRGVVGEGSVDLLLLLDGDPMTLRQHRTRSAEFLRACAARLAPGGVLVLRAGVSDTYLAGAGAELLATLASTLQVAVGPVQVLAGEGVLLVAGGGVPAGGYALEELVRRWEQRGVEGESFAPWVLAGWLDPYRRQRLEEFLRGSPAPPSTAAHPRAVLWAALHAEGRAGARLATVGAASARLPRGWVGLAVGLAAVLVVGVAAGRGTPAPVAACVGMCSMGWWMLLLGTWQAAEGSVYAEVGVLSGAFMAGLAAGAHGAARARSAGAWLSAALAVGVVVSLAVASGAALVWPRGVTLPLLLAAGWSTGAAFPGLATLAGRRDERGGAGRTFAADELGAALGALCLGTFALPWLGLRAAGLALAGLGLAALVALKVGQRRGVFAV